MILPSKGNLLIEVLKAEKQTKAGIYLPDTSQEDSMLAKVLAIGGPKVKEGGVVEEAPSFTVQHKNGTPTGHKLEVGDTILFRSHAINPIPGELNGENTVGFLSFESVMGLEIEEE